MTKTLLKRAATLLVTTMLVAAPAWAQTTGPDRYLRAARAPASAAPRQNGDAA